MKRSASAKWILAYGGFLILAGLAGYLSNPEKAKTALMSGGTAGTLSILWGWFATQERRWAWMGALVTTGLLTLVFAWRTLASWQAVAAGEDGKLFAACLISSMLAASLCLLPVLVRGAGIRTPVAAETPHV
ncbi:MAG: TMEM14 family protein [Verrucomicrobiae bacterium]|nr:TMEM14 family protein [Verrucomicrobiae bacterium]